MGLVARCFCLTCFLAGSVSAAPPTVDLKLVVNQLTNLVAIANAGDGSGRLFLIEQAGRIKVFDGTNVLATPFLSITSLVTFSPGGEQGLLALTFNPGYSTNGQFYVYYTRTSDGALTLARYNVSVNPNVADAGSAAVLLTIPHPGASNHNGGQLAFGPDGYLYISTGDGGSGCDPPNNSQTLTSLLGKMLRIDVNTNVSYRIPPTNPFAGSLTKSNEVWAYGLRNPWRFSFDKVTGDILIGDVGQNDREEIDFQPFASSGGENYGWHCYEGFLTNTCSGAGAVCSNFPSVLPILDHTRTEAQAIVGGYRYRGNQIPPLYGYYVYGDEAIKRIYGATNTTGGAWATTGLTNNTPLTVTTFGQDQAGELYVSHYSGGSAGALYKIVWKDTDNDGLPDDWEQQYFGNATNVSANADSDGDNVNNLGEFLSGTDPANAASVLRVASTQANGADWTVSFNAVSNKIYRVEYTDDLVAGVWTNITGNLIGAGNPITVTDTNAAGLPRRFYRLYLLP